MHMNLKKFLILIICIMIQTICVVSAEEDITQDQAYKNAIQKSKQINSGEQTVSQTTSISSDSYARTQTAPQPVPSNNMTNTMVVPTIPHVQYPPVAIPMHISDRQIKYNKIIEANSNLFKNNKEVIEDYINAVEDYRKTYGDESLKYKNINNYVPILKNLGLAYENTSRINDAIATYEILQKEKPADLNIKKHLLSLYDEITSCIDAENMLSQIKLYEPSYNTNMVNCSEPVKVQDLQNINHYQNNESTTPISKPSSNDNYNWNIIYMAYFGLWGLIFILWININKIEQYFKSDDSENTYYIKFDNNNCPIKPTIEEFGFNQTSYDQVIELINSAGNLDVISYISVPLTMIIITSLFNAPYRILPIFKTTFGIIFGLIFLVIGGIALSKILKIIHSRAFGKNIRNYYNYVNAIKLYDEAKSKYDKELKRIEEEKRNAKERERWKQKDYWYNLDPFKFEEKIGELFRNLGYNVTVTKKSGDGGIDVLIKKGHTTIGVQCKRYKDKVGAKEVRELWAVKDYFKLNGKVQKIDRVIMIALSGVSKPAYEFIQQFPEYELWTINTILANAKEVNYSYTHF